MANLNNKNYNTAYYIGSVERFSFGNGTKTVVVFSNPKDSCTYIHMNQILLSNLSCNPIMINIHFCTRITGTMNSSSRIISGDLSCTSKSSSCARIYWGSGDALTSDRHLFTQMVSPNTTYNSTLFHDTCLPPGTNQVYVFDTSNALSQATASMAFTWWEDCRTR